MGVAESRCTVDNNYDTYIDSFIIPKFDYDHRFYLCNLEIGPNYQENKVIRILRTLHINFLSENHTKEIFYAYNYVMENLTDDQKERKKLLGNNNNLCAAMYFFMARKKVFHVKKSRLIKFLGIESSHFQSVFNNLEKMAYFEDLIKHTRKKETSRNIIKFIPVSEVPLKVRKPPKKIEKKSPKPPIKRFKTAFFHFFFYVFAKKKKFINKSNSLLIEKSSYRDLAYLKSKMKLRNNLKIINQHNFSSKFFPVHTDLILKKKIGDCFFKYYGYQNHYNSFNVVNSDIKKNYKKSEKYVKI